MADSRFEEGGVGAPLVDILMATYNGERYLAEQIESIRAQTWQSWRLLVSDDGSHDATVDIVRRYMSEDSRIELVNGSESGQGSCRNFLGLLACSRAPYVCFCDQDDVWDVHKVQESLNVMRDLEGEDREPTLVFSDLEVVDEGLDTIAPSFEEYQQIDYRRNGLMQVAVYPLSAGCTMMLNRTLADLVLVGANEPDITMHDWWVTLVAAAFGRMGHVGHATIKYRQHRSNTLGSSGASVGQTLAGIAGAEWAIKRSMRQMRSFLHAYGDRLDAGKREAVASFVRAASAPRLLRPFLLLRSGAWKRGPLRSAGEMLVVIAMRSGLE